MKHNIKVPVLYACVAFLIVTAVIYETTGYRSVHHLITETYDYIRSPKVWDQQLRDDESTLEEEEESEDVYSITVTKTATFKEVATEIPFRNVTVGNNISLATNNSSQGSDLSTGSLGDAFEVVPLRDVAPSVYIEKMPQELCHTDEGVDLTDSPLKTILIWNDAYGSKSMGFGFGRAPFQLARCEVDTCFVTANRSLHPSEKFDAIIFHFRGVSPRDMPKYRSYHQRWIFREVESSSYVYQDPAVYNGLFNWTMTYRRDSDIVYTYGRVFPGETKNLTAINKNYAAGKTKMAAWFVSNCRTHSRREKLVKALQKYFKVDIFGKCGPYTCPHKYGKRCLNLLAENYKFYLSFENSLCKDYVTEKLFKVLKYNVVPVVFGLADYRHIAPPGSFVNALQFPDVDSLAKHLKYLDGNDTAYNEYFRWKGHYKIDNGWSNEAQPFCDLCKKLHHDHSPKVYYDIKKWFVIQGNCKTLKTKYWMKLLR